MENQTFINKIVSQLKALVNEFAFNRMTENAYLDPEKILENMIAYGDLNLGNYARRTLFGKLF